MLFSRVFTALDKLAFCLRVSSVGSSLFKLLWNSKRYTWSKNGKTTFDNKYERYSLTLLNNSRPVYLRTFAGDIQIFYDIFWHSIYLLAPEHFKHARTIVDLGAHVGLASLFFKLLSPGASVYAVEADEENFQMLEKNLAPEIENGQVIPIHAALAEDNTKHYLQRASLSYNTRISDSRTDQVVKGIEIDQLLREYEIKSIDILKVDIEGAERFLFSGDSSWLGIVKNVLIEIHSNENLELFKRAATLHRFEIKKLNAPHEDIYWAAKTST